MNIPVSRSPAQVWVAFLAGSLALLRAWLVLYPSRHIGFTASPLLIGLEVVKTIALFLILSRVYMLNSDEDDQAVRSKHVYTFQMLSGRSN
jgi:hypothetical protein